MNKFLQSVLSWEQNNSLTLPGFTAMLWVIRSLNMSQVGINISSSISEVVKSKTCCTKVDKRQEKVEYKIYNLEGWLFLLQSK